MNTTERLKELSKSYYEGTASEQELEQLSLILKESSSAREFFSSEMSSLEQSGCCDASVMEAFEALGSKIGRPAASKRHSLRWSAVACSFAAAAAIVLTVILWPSSAVRDNSAQTIVAALSESGEMTVVTLADSTVVRLAPGARLVSDADFSATNRKVSLDGQAFFSVKSDAIHPFEITAGECNVTVLGTVFDLNTAGDNVKVTLVEGKVDFTAPGIAHRMTPGESLTYSAGNRDISIAGIDADAYRLWMDGDLEYFDLTLSELAYRISMLYGKNIVLDQELASLERRYSIRLSNHEDMSEVMDMLNILVQMTVEETVDNTVMCRISH